MTRGVLVQHRPEVGLGYRVSEDDLVESPSFLALFNGENEMGYREADVAGLDQDVCGREVGLSVIKDDRDAIKAFGARWNSAWQRAKIIASRLATNRAGSDFHPVSWG